MTDWVEITAEPIAVEAAVAFITDPAAGGIDLFLGMTRAETSPEHRKLAALDYEAYAEMAQKQLEGLVAAARARWPILKAAILHRTGRVAVGQASVVIAVSTPHRAQAFKACRFLIDELKRDVAIWKREVWEDGPGSWVHPEVR